VDFCRAVSPADGFRLDKGAYETIALPGASLTVPYRSNDRGQVVGAYIVPDGTLGGRTHGFVYERGRFRTVDGPRRAPTELLASTSATRWSPPTRTAAARRMGC
jgi:hypothetical protein